MLVIWALAAIAQAQVVEPQCPPAASCHPNGAGLGMGLTSGDADAIGNELNRRRREGDCTGLGPDGCAALILNQLMCLVDNRDWVQQYACADPPPPISGGGAGGGPGGGAGGDAGAPAPGGDVPAPGGDAPAPAPEPDPEATIFVVHPDLSRWLRASALRSRPETPLLSIKYGDRGGVDYLVAGVFEWNPADASEYFVVLRAVDVTTRRHVHVVVGTAGRSVYATPHAWLTNLKLGTGR